MDNIVIVIAIVIIVALKTFKYYLTNVYNFWKKRGVNGPIPLPIFGNFITHFTTPANQIEQQRFLKYGQIYGTFEFSQPILNIADAEIIREIAIKYFSKFRNHYNRMPGDEFLGKTISLIKDDEWKSLRSQLSPMFTNNKMKRMFQCADKCANDFVEYIYNEIEQEVHLKPAMLTYTLDVIAKCAFAVNTNGYKDPNNEFLIRARHLADISLFRLFFVFIIPKSIKKLHSLFNLEVFDQKTMDYFKKVLNLLIAERKNNKMELNDFVTFFLTLEENEKIEDADGERFSEFVSDLKESIKMERKTLTKDELLAQLFIFFLAGYETTSTLLNFTLYTLAMNPEIQERLHDEIVEYLYGENNLDFDTIHSMVYLDAVVNESLRMFPPFVASDRVASEDIVLGDGCLKIEKDTVVNISIYNVLHDPKYFPDPNSFKPERFLPENKHLIIPYTFIPFGIGPRNCIGMRFALMTIKTFLIRVLKKFKIQKTSKTVKKPEYTVLFHSLSSKPFIVAFTPR